MADFAMEAVFPFLVNSIAFDNSQSFPVILSDFSLFHVILDHQTVLLEAIDQSCLWAY
jgi:hypothetical protein